MNYLNIKLLVGQVYIYKQTGSALVIKEINTIGLHVRFVLSDGYKWYATNRFRELIAEGKMVSLDKLILEDL